MKTLWAALAVYVGLFILFVVASVLVNLYKWLRRKTNKPLVGYDNIDIKLLKRDDFLSIDHKIFRYSHLTNFGELAFKNPHELGGYYIYPSTVLKKCDFIYGKYGAKWGYSRHWASIAKDKVEEYIKDH